MSAVVLAQGRVYPPGACVRPTYGDGPLCVVRRRSHAERFVDGRRGRALGRFHILACAYLPSDYGAVWRYRSDARLLVCHATLDELPDGTVLADAVYCWE